MLNNQYLVEAKAKEKTEKLKSKPDVYIVFTVKIFFV